MLTTSIWTETHRYLKIHPPSHISTVVHQVTAIEKTFEDALKPITHHYRYVYKYKVQICRYTNTNMVSKTIWHCPHLS